MWKINSIYVPIWINYTILHRHALIEFLLILPIIIIRRRFYKYEIFVQMESTESFAVPYDFRVSGF